VHGSPSRIGHIGVGGLRDIDTSCPEYYLT